VICSPFLRCVQTAVEICKATGAPLIIDQGWGEVRFHEMVEAECNKQQELNRPYQYLAAYVAEHGVKLRNPDAPCGNDWNRTTPETLQDARVRYARKFVIGLDRAMLSQTSFIVVSHGESLPACIQLFPDYRGSEVVSTPFCGMVVGRLEQSSTSRRRSTTESLEKTGIASTSDASALAGILEDLSVIDTTCKVDVTIKATVKEGRPNLPGWMRSRQVKFRASSALMKALGILTSTEGSSGNAAEATSREPLQPAAQTPVEVPYSFQTELSIECDWDHDLIELPPVAPRPQAGSSSLMACDVGASTMLIGGCFTGASSTFLPDWEDSQLLADAGAEEEEEPRSAGLLQPDSASGVPSVASLEEKGEETPGTPKKRRREKRGVKGPTQPRPTSPPTGCARQEDRRSAENFPATSATKVAESVHFEAYRSAPDLDVGMQTAKSDTIPSDPVPPPRAHFAAFAQDATGPPVPNKAMGSAPNTTVVSEKTAVFPKWRLSYSKNGKSAQVSPVFEDPVAESFKSVMAHSPSGNSGAMVSGGPSLFASPSVASASAGASSSSGQSSHVDLQNGASQAKPANPVKLSNLVSNSLFQRRRIASESESDSK
jgi:broad specificity phosphatase PhoE